MIGISGGDPNFVAFDKYDATSMSFSNWTVLNRRIFCKCRFILLWTSHRWVRNNGVCVQLRSDTDTKGTEGGMVFRLSIFRAFLRTLRLHWFRGWCFLFLKLLSVRKQRKRSLACAMDSKASFIH